MSQLDDRISSIPPLAIDFNRDIDEVLALPSTNIVNADGVPGVRLVEQRRTGASFDRFVAFSPNVDVLWPGCLVQGRSLRSGSLAPINVPRTPVQLNINVSDKTFETGELQNPRAGTVMRYIADTISGWDEKSITARVSYGFKSCFDLEDGLLRVGASAEWVSGQVRADLRSSSKKTTSRAVFKLVVAYFDASVDAPTSPASFIVDSDAVADQMRHYMGQENPPCYISTVTFGRIIIATFATSSKIDDYGFSLQAAFDVLAASGSVALDEQQRRMLSESEVNLMVLGGEAGPAVEHIRSDLKIDRIDELMKAGAKYKLGDPVVPISYQARYLSNNEVARLSFVTDYKVSTEHYPFYARGLTLTVQGLHFHDTADDDEDLDFGYSIEAIGNGDVVVGRLGNQRIDVYVEEPGKVGGWRDGVNKFFAGERMICHDVVQKLRIHVWAKTRDGDGLDWRPLTQECKPHIGDVSVSGGGQGRYQLNFSVSAAP